MPDDRKNYTLKLHIPDMSWHLLEQENQLIKIKEHSKTIPQIIFKHSTRCSISTMIKKRLETSVPPVNINFHYLDLLKYRSLSNQIAVMFGVPHESPQILLIKDDVCIFDQSHNGIDMQDIVEVIGKKI